MYMHDTSTRFFNSTKIIYETLNDGKIMHEKLFFMICSLLQHMDIWCCDQSIYNLCMCFTCMQILRLYG